MPRAKLSSAPCDEATGSYTRERGGGLREAVVYVRGGYTWRWLHMVVTHGCYLSDDDDDTEDDGRVVTYGGGYMVVTWWLRATPER